jgi:hypothetical protein
MAQELVAVMGDRQPARMAVEQLDAEIGFQLLQRFRNRGLRDRQVLRGPRDGALLGDGDEILDLARVKAMRVRAWRRALLQACKG